MISIITPTYNRKDMLKQAIESVRRQTYDCFEIIIIDDCSTDGTDQFIKRYETDQRIKYYRNEINQGPGYNRNLGFKKARGEYIIFMDDDDYYTDINFFKKAINIFEENQEKNIAFVSANSVVEYVETGKKVNANIGVVGLVNGIDFLLNLKVKYNKPQSTFTTIFRFKCLQEAELYNMEMVNDYAIYLRALIFGDAYILDDRIGIYRLHKNNISNNIKMEFLLKNLYERAWVKDKLIINLPIKKVNQWWNIQMLTLLKYYLFGTNPELKKGFTVLIWILRNSNKSLCLWIISLTLFILYKPINFVKKIGR